MKTYRIFRKKYRALHLLMVSTALVFAWWGLWGILDTYLVHLREWGYLVAIAIALIVFYLDYNIKDYE